MVKVRFFLFLPLIYIPIVTVPVDKILKEKTLAYTKGERTDISKVFRGNLFYLIVTSVEIGRLFR